MALLLPPDAVVRNLELKEAQPPVFVLEYTLPGDPVEREKLPTYRDPGTASSPLEFGRRALLAQLTRPSDAGGRQPDSSGPRLPDQTLRPLCSAVEVDA